MILNSNQLSPNTRNTNNAEVKEQIRKACTSHYNTNQNAAADVQLNIRKVNVNGGLQNRLAEIQQQQQLQQNQEEALVRPALLLQHSYTIDKNQIDKNKAQNLNPSRGSQSIFVGQLAQGMLVQSNQMNQSAYHP